MAYGTVQAVTSLLLNIKQEADRVQHTSQPQEQP